MKPKHFCKSFFYINIELLIITILIFYVSSQKSFSQAEIMPWGNIRSFHVDGEKMNFETSLRSVYADWSGCISSERCNWQGTQTYSFEGKTTKMSHFLQALPLNFSNTFIETGTSSVTIDLSIEATDVINQAGTYFCFEIPGSEFVDGTLDIFSGQSKAGSVILKSSIPDGKTEYIKTKGNKIIVKTAKRGYEVISDNNTVIIVKQNHIDRPAYLNDPLPAKKFVASDPNQPVAPYQIYFTLIDGKAKKGDKKIAKYTINLNGSVDKEDVNITLDPASPGRPFNGVGGNFRIHGRDKDTLIVNYCLDSLRTAWSRVPLDWKEWQPEENMDPIANARAGKLSKVFYDQIIMTQILAKRHIPIILSVWSPPTWAVDSTKHNRTGLQHDPMISLNAKKVDKIGKSLADYIWYLKTEYGIEIQLFSFNEVDYGVQVYHTPEEHAFYIKMLGKSFATRGLITKMLLGDTGAGTVRSNKIVIPAVNDITTHEYIGAVSFHTYHGCTPPDLQAWALSAQKLNVPLMVVEGGPNSAEHRYPMNFIEKWFQLSEIDLYLRICRYAQPATIMEWQFTRDYSLLIGNGIYNDNGPLRPTQRFWNLKQLGSTPEGSFSIPLEVDGSNITAAAFADILDGIYTIHIVNNSAQRKAIIKNIASNIKTLNVYKTDITRGMQRAESVQVINGTAEVVLESACYTTLTNSIFK